LQSPWPHAILKFGPILLSSQKSIYMYALILIVFSDFYRFELMIVWKIQVDEKGNIIPVLDLLNKIPLQVANKFASDAPQGFRSLLHMVGIQASIETVINSISKGK
uniref:Centromere protein P n=1 Tax=Pseudonaja textilis TaxID=8673 RepID=A0A670YRP2_PSETE